MRWNTRLVKYSTPLWVQSYGKYNCEGLAFPLAELLRRAGNGNGVEINNRENKGSVIWQTALETEPCPQGAQVVPEVRDACRLDPREDGLSNGNFFFFFFFFLWLWCLPQCRSVKSAVVAQAGDRRAGGEPAQGRPCRCGPYQRGDESVLHRGQEPCGG